jgi:hypothetical protein
MSFYVYDVVTQRLSGQHYSFVDSRLEASPTEKRYAWPAELDLMAWRACDCRTAGQGGAASRSGRSALRTGPSTRTSNGSRAPGATRLATTQARQRTA